jgi:hypothetical protein
MRLTALDRAIPCELKEGKPNLSRVGMLRLPMQVGSSGRNGYGIAMPASRNRLMMA